MESEKVKEIKKALENNTKYEHQNKLGYVDGYECKTVAYADILTYINELESENERLGNCKSVYIQEILDQRDEFEKQCVGWVEIYQKKKEENQKLKDENERLILQYERVKADSEMNCLELKDRIAELEEDKEKWQRKAVNYYQRAKSYGIECIIDNDIDETLKEFINE